MRFLIILFTLSGLTAQTIRHNVFAKLGQLSSQFKLEGRAVTNILKLDERIYITTERTVMYSDDNGNNWNQDASLLSADPKIGKTHSPIKLFKDSKDWLWLSLAVDTTDILGESQDAGAGIAFKIAGQSDWRLLKQPLDPDNYDPNSVVTPIKSPIQNLSYDIDETYSPTDAVQRRIWIASWGGSLRYIHADSLTDPLWLPNWAVHPPNGDKLNFGTELNKLQQVTFSLASDQNLLWVGTAYGIYYSQDYGDTFVNYSFSPGLSLPGQASVTGNFITTLYYHKEAKQLWSNSRITNFGDQGESSAIDVLDFTDLNNPTFSSLLENEAWAYSFTAEGDSILLGTNNGFYIYNNALVQRLQQDSFQDDINDLSLNSAEIFSVYKELATIWVGSGDGLARSINNGNDWLVFKSSKIKESVDKEDTVIPVPSPYSPIHSNNEMSFVFPQRKSGRTSISIYNFAMEEVQVLEDYRIENNPAIIYWNGKDKNGRYVANGVYFIRVKTPSDSYWNKLVIIN